MSSNPVFDELMRQGRIAFAQDDYDGAHELWRKAATQDPFKEEVWQALLQVVQTSADRYVCLENIVKINPTNETAARQLRAMTLMMGKFTGEDSSTPRNRFSLPSASTTIKTLWRGIKTLVIMILLFALGLGIGLVLNELILQ